MSMTPHEVILEKIAALDNALKTAHPSMPNLLRDILIKLKNDPEVVTLLKEEEIGLLVKSAIKHTGTTIATAALKSTKGKSARSITLEDL